LKLSFVEPDFGLPTSLVQPFQVTAMNFRQIVLFAFCCLASDAAAQQSDNLDDPTAMTREQWRSRVEAAKLRIQEMRREGKSMIPPPDEDLLRRILEDGTLVYGDIVVTEGGMFKFIGKPEAPHNPEDFRRADPERSPFPP
jgi:hypothetical protein